MFKHTLIYLFTKEKIMTLKRPAEHESNAYFKRYINQVTGDDFLTVLENLAVSTPAMMEGWTPSQWEHRYAPGKWSAKEALMHMMDTERIFCYRALRIARNDLTPLLGFEQDDYVPYYAAEQRTAESLLDEFRAIRQATITLFRNFTDEMMDRIGTASGNPISVRALGFMIAGHELHHLQIFKEKYLV